MAPPGPGKLDERRRSLIGRREILDQATRLGLNPHVIEKDYVLGWVLAGINQHPALAESWVFKGGTCLKKCYFETYRFSEDLDFTLTAQSHLDEGFLHGAFTEIAGWIYEQTGIELSDGGRSFEIYLNSRGKSSCQGRLSYRGPVSPRSGGLPRLKLDLTADEVLVLPPVRTPIFHPYSDAPKDDISVLAYAYEEAFGEKVRALAERTRPRDLYDVVNLFRNDTARPSPAVLLDVLGQKCAFKGIAVPALADLEPQKPNLEGAWEGMLGHQLPALPPVEAFWDELPVFFAWLRNGQAPEGPAAYAMGAGETVIRERRLRLPVSGPAQSYIEIIRFAAANRLCVDLDYQGSTRRIEPYSLRRTQEDNIILHAFRAADGEHRSYRVDRIEGARSTNEIFIPRYEVELTSEGPVRVAPTAVRSTAPFGMPSRVRTTSRTRSNTLHGRTSGPTHVYSCTLYGKQFYRKTLNAALRPHKDKHDSLCSGRHGIWVDTRY